jgi:negative regulator of sigma E activity
MKVIPLAIAACVTAGVAMAQQATNPPNSTAAPANTTTSRSHNPAVATTSNANDSAAPAKGSNSFTEAQAKDRIAQRGYTNVADLKKDNDGVWRGTARHSGQAVQVWLDYKGNIGEAR